MMHGNEGDRVLTEPDSVFVVSSRIIHDAGKPASHGHRALSTTSRNAILESPEYPESGRTATALLKAHRVIPAA